MVSASVGVFSRGFAHNLEDVVYECMKFCAVLGNKGSDIPHKGPLVIRIIR